PPRRPEDHRPGARDARALRRAGGAQPRRPARARQHVVGDAAPHLDAHPRRSGGRAGDADREPGLRPRADPRRRREAQAVMLALPTAPSLLQAPAMAVDEGWYHNRRGLPRWERIGHPLDTLTVAATYGYALVVGPGRAALIGYAGLA